jgi:hypothetical protein
MIIKITAFTSAQDVDTLTLDSDGSPETDFIQIRDVVGLDPVKANLNTAVLGIPDGSIYIDGDVPSRNIVLTLRPNPDWDDWTPEALRQLLFSYFMPKNEVKLVIESEELPTVEIFGIVEDCSANPFSKDPEFLVSIVCMDPYFTAVTPFSTFGTAVALDSVAFDTFTIAGNIPIGMKLTMDHAALTYYVGVQVGDPPISMFRVVPSAFSAARFQMDSRPRHKYVRDLNTADGDVLSLIPYIASGSVWPLFRPGDNKFALITESGGESWFMTYYERFGGF